MHLSRAGQRTVITLLRNGIVIPGTVLVKRDGDPLGRTHQKLSPCVMSVEGARWSGP